MRHKPGFLMATFRRNPIRGRFYKEFRGNCHQIQDLFYSDAGADRDTLARALETANRETAYCLTFCGSRDLPEDGKIRYEMLFEPGRVAAFGKEDLHNPENQGTFTPPNNGMRYGVLIEIDFNECRAKGVDICLVDHNKDPAVELSSLDPENRVAV